MGDKLRTIKAACRCGLANHEITLPESAFPLDAHLCHCSSCRHITGFMFLSVMSLPPTYAPDAALADILTPFDFTPYVRHYFCPNCGTTMFLRCSDGPDTDIDYVVPIGTLSEGDTSVYEINKHIFLTDTLDGGFSDFLTNVGGKSIQRWHTYIDDEDKQLPLFWSSPSRALIKTPPGNDRLHGHCKCRGVQFWIAPPSERSARAKEAYETGTFDSNHPLPPESDTHWLRASRTRFKASVCPCDSCRLTANGNAFAQWATIPTVDASLDTEGKTPLPKDLIWGTMKKFKSSEHVSWHFCGTCGAAIIWNGHTQPYVNDFGIGLFESPDGARAESWFDWETVPMSFREDGLQRAEKLTLAVERGLSEYAKHRQSR